MKKFFVVLILLVVVGGAYAYTYDGEINPNNLFTYEPLFVEQLSPVTALMVIGKENAEPRYVVVCVMRAPGGLVILAYAYYDGETLKHYMINKDTSNYDDHPFNPNVPAEAELEKKIRSLLDTFYGYSDC